MNGVRPRNAKWLLAPAARKESHQRGAVATEFILVFPLAILTFAMSLQLMLMGNTRQLVQCAAFRACRSAAVYGTVREEPPRTFTVPLIGIAFPIASGKKTYAPEEDRMKEVAGGVLAPVPGSADAWKEIRYWVADASEDGSAKAKVVGLGGETKPFDITDDQLPTVTVEVRYRYKLVPVLSAVMRAFGSSRMKVVGDAVELEGRASMVVHAGSTPSAEIGGGGGGAR